MKMNILCLGILLLASLAFAGLESNPPESSYPDLFGPTMGDCSAENLKIEAKVELAKTDFLGVCFYPFIVCSLEMSNSIFMYCRN